ncbi:ABC transporter permease [Muribacter muris]|uniref:ABC transporter permease n=1 Tax=Muribacter muris TaxID=67855 RepID=A0A4Y9JWL9_9PAST|nr:iron chelate uptake ABC transporter family permease subunit [Muribacter muris]MBF0785662.1 iron chelate uptake ABC transporter family permease subunit [Muribacter muris]MBF0828333.1 iron chelate uptake ABC transporter family permease subunit [Muribacter muris]TFV08836.1 ABC transporter permease [Muribacter muris]
MFSLHRVNLFILLLLFSISITTGVADFDWTTLFTQPEQMQLLLISRLPRTLAVLLVGATLAVAGMVLQIVLKNRFIDPSMIGATQSAGIGILLASLVFPTAALLGKMAIATLCALVGMGIFSLLLQRLPPHQQLMVPLVGIIFGNIIDAIGTFIAYETDSLQLLSVWTSGDFSGILAGRYELLWLTAGLALLIYFMADQLTIAGLGKNICTNLGINYQQMTWLALVLVAMITAVVVVTVGQIPFIGLVVPNIVCRLAGDRLRQNLPVVALLGANLVLGCDILGRVINAPYEIPISTVFGVLGTLIFLYLLFKGKRNAH